MSNATRTARRSMTGGRSPKGPFTVAIGGPSYRMELDARHACSFYALIREGEAQQIYVNGWNYKHAVPVEYAREFQFGEVLGFKAKDEPAPFNQWDVLLWMDSDVFWSPEQTPNVLYMLRRVFARNLPFATAPCMIRGVDGLSNIWREDNGHGVQMTMAECYERGPEPFPIYSSGLGIGAFNLNVYRNRWPKSPWFMTHVDDDGRRLSEDTWHTVQLKKRTGRHGFCFPQVKLIHADRGAARVGLANEKIEARTPSSAA